MDPLQSPAGSWGMWAVIIALVAPLYGHAAYMLWKRWQTSQNMLDIEEHSDEIDSNREGINEIRHKLVRIEYDLELIENDLQVIHDNVADENHCASDHCRWCERDEEGG